MASWKCKCCQAYLFIQIPQLLKSKVQYTLNYLIVLHRKYFKLWMLAVHQKFVLPHCAIFSVRHLYLVTMVTTSGNNFFFLPTFSCSIYIRRGNSKIHFFWKPHWRGCVTKMHTYSITLPDKQTMHFFTLEYYTLAPLLHSAKSLNLTEGKINKNGKSKVIKENTNIFVSIVLL